MKEVEEVEILPGTFADHKPLLVIMKDQLIRRTWKFNTIHLKNKEFRKEVEKEMKGFFENNIQEDISMSTVWETSKAYFRGIAIRQGKEKSQKFKDLKERLGREDKLKLNPNNKQLRDTIKLVQHKINLILMEEIERNIKFAKQNFFEHANKPGKWLAFRVKRKRTKNWVAALKDKVGKVFTSQEDLKKICTDFYKELYQKTEISKDLQGEYLRKNNKMIWKEEHKKLLDEPISACEIIETIKRQKSGKAPGPDGIPSEVYNSIQDVILLLYKEVLRKIQEEGEIPESWKEATVSLIHKEGSEKTR